jgi:hypothetical protein
VGHDTEHSSERIIGKRLHLWEFHGGRVSGTAAGETYDEVLRTTSCEPVVAARGRRAYVVDGSYTIG